MFTFPICHFSGASKVPSLVFNEFQDKGNSGPAICTFSGVSFGDATPNRIICCGVMQSTYALSSATIGGVSATILHSGGGNGNQHSLIYAVVPTGTTGDVVLNWGGAGVTCKMSCYTVYDATDTTPYDSAIVSSLSMSGITIPDNSVLVAIGSTQLNGAFSWSGTAGVSEDCDFSTSTHYRLSTASLTQEAEVTGKTITASGGGGIQVMSRAIWI